MNYYQKKIAKLKEEKAELLSDIRKMVKENDLSILIKYQTLFDIQDSLDEQFNHEHDLIMQHINGTYPKTMQGIYPQMIKKTTFMTKVIVYLKNKLYLWRK